MCFSFVLTIALIFAGERTSAEIAGCVSAHNAVRSLHLNTGSVTWDSALAAGAQQWAEHLANLGGLSHSSGSYGENLYYGGDSKQKTCAEAVLAWYNELNDYSYGTTKTTNGKAIGHFTQVVWKASVRIGVGLASVNSGGFTNTYIVARYAPQGNFVQMRYGESYDSARQRIYTAQVARRKSGAKTPTLYELNPQQCADGLNGQCSLYIKYYTCGHSYVKNNCPKSCIQC